MNRHRFVRASGVAAITLLIQLVFGQPAAAIARKGPVKVFILAGQSNMEGQGKIKMDVNRNRGKGSLEYLVKDPATAERFKHIVDGKGKWVVRDDVWIWCFDRKGPLTVGYGARSDRIGPEFQFGHVIGDYLDDQVLLIKTAWGGKSLAVDFSPPGADGKVGPYYTEMLKHIREVMGNLKKHFADYDGRGYEIAGFGWHQGWNDGCSVEQTNQYEKNLAHFIRDIRKELGVKNLPFVIADSGFGGPNQRVGRRLKIRQAQAAVAKYEEFKGNVICVETKNFFRPPEASPSRQGYHWNSNAETYFLIGDGMGKAMIKLIENKRDAEKKITFDLTKLDKDGLRGPPNGKVAVSYEFCIPDKAQCRKKVKAIDPSVRFSPGSAGRIGCKKDQCLSIGSTHQPNFRKILYELAALPYIERIDECFFE